MYFKSNPTLLKNPHQPEQSKVSTSSLKLKKIITTLLDRFLDTKDKRHDALKFLFALYLSENSDEEIVSFLTIYKDLQEKDKIYENAFLTFEVLSLVQHLLFYKNQFDSFTFYSFLKTFKKSCQHKNLNVRLIAFDLVQKFIYSIEEYTERDYQIIKKVIFTLLKTCHKEDRQTIMESFKSLYLIFNFYQKVSDKFANF